MKRHRGTRAEEVQRWLGWALKVGDRKFGVKFMGNWASLEELACAAASERRFHDLTAETFKQLVQEDESCRFEINGSQVRKVPRSERGKRRHRSAAASLRSLKRSRSPSKDAHSKPYYIKATIHNAAADLKLTHRTEELVQESCDADEEAIGYYKRSLQNGSCVYIKVVHGTETVGVSTPIAEILWAKQKLYAA